jgi:DNA-cytosine methyltransferase
MRHLDLFSGIGGFSLAAQWVWGDEYENVGFCDNNEFCQAVLKKNFKNAKIYSDIRELDGTKIKNLDLLTGGFPCQPFSFAGKRRGNQDDRYLWPEMLRIIREARPHWIVGENVAGIINLALDQVLLDLERESYTFQVFVIPACAVQAPHRRDRVWIVAYDGADAGGERAHRRGIYQNDQLSGRGGVRHGARLGQIVPRLHEILPTPKAQDSRAGLTDRGKSNFGEVVQGTTGLRLQPIFVEWMMGFPENWTDASLPQSSTA